MTHLRFYPSSQIILESMDLLMTNYGIFKQVGVSVGSTKYYSAGNATGMFGIVMDGDYIYSAGDYLNPSGYYQGWLTKISKNNLSVVASKQYGGSNHDKFYGIDQDTNYLYLVGHVDHGMDAGEAAVVKVSKTDLSVSAAKKIVASSYTETFVDVVVDDNYVFACGYTSERGEGSDDCMIVRFNKSDLSATYLYTYGGSARDRFIAIDDDDTYVYVVGYTASEGLGEYDGIIYKIRKSDMAVVARKRYSGSESEKFYGVKVDGSYVYVVGYTESEGPQTLPTYYPNALLLRFNKSDLSLAGGKVYGLAGGSDYFRTVEYDANYIYAAGLTAHGGIGGEDAMIVKFNKSDLSIVSSKAYGYTHPLGSDIHYDLVVDVDKVYCCGNLDIGGSKGNVIEYDIELPAGDYTTIPSSDLKLKDLTMTLQNSSLTLADSTLTSHTYIPVLSNLTYSMTDLSVTESSLYNFYS